MLKNVKKLKGLPRKKVLKTGEMLKMLKVFWVLTPPPPFNFQNVLKTGEMLKMLKF